MPDGEAQKIVMIPEGCMIGRSKGVLLSRKISKDFEFILLKNWNSPNFSIKRYVG